MTLPVVHVDAEDVALEWLLTTSVAPLLMKNGYVQAYLAMPKGFPLPVVVLSRVGGAPVFTSAVPYDRARISFQCWAANRPQAKAIAKALISEAESICVTGPSITTSGRIEAIQTVSEVWLPDPGSDTSRYVVDLLMTVRGNQ